MRFLPAALIRYKHEASAARIHNPRLSLVLERSLGRRRMHAISVP
jgi:hypothetical protein